MAVRKWRRSRIMQEAQKLSGWFAVPVAIVVWGVFSLWEWTGELFSGSETASTETKINPAPQQDIGKVLPKISSEDEVFVCRATIAELMSRDIATVTGVRRADGNVGVSYRRPSDNSLWNNLCKIDGTRVVWASMNESGVAGRWRTGEADEAISFVLGESGVTITQKFGDGTSLSDSFGRE
jgi:hypothetical protein